ncbi:hypothetical protein B1218_37460, partial [Pseudomonas ogarae]
MSFECGKALRNGMALCALACVLNGCANTGDLGNLMGSLNQGAKKYDVSYLKQTIIPGQTTKSQITPMSGVLMNEELYSPSPRNKSNWASQKTEDVIDKNMNLP